MKILEQLLRHRVTLDEVVGEAIDAGAEICQAEARRAIAEFKAAQMRKIETRGARPPADDQDEEIIEAEPEGK